MKYVPWKDYKAVTADLKKIYQATKEELAILALEEFIEKMGFQIPSNQPLEEEPLGGLQHLVLLSSRHPQSNLYDQRHRISKQCDS